jgi:KDO2-lipid IV(A) lauroyltransferase
MKQSVDGRKPPLSYRVATWLASRAPDPVLEGVARCGGFVHYWTAGQKRRDYLSNLATCGEIDGVRPWRAFQNHALNIAELLGATRESPSALVSRVAIHGLGHVDSALAGGRGLILVTMHSGNWELAGLSLAAAGYPVTTVAGLQLREGWSEAVKAFKEKFGIRAVSPERGVRGLYRDLTSNRVVALHLDGDVFSGGIEATLLGRSIKVPRGPAHLSRLLRAPTAFAYCRRAPRAHLDLYIEPLKSPPDEPSGEEALTREYVRRIEKCILEDPSQWCIFRKL